MVRIMAFLLPFLAFALAPSPVSRSAEILTGPVAARLLRVIDGDTISVSARIWLGQDVQTLVRVDGVDTPELRGKCPAERQLAIRARDFVIAFLGRGGLLLRDIQYGKFAGRVVSRVLSSDGRDRTDALARRGVGIHRRQAANRYRPRPRRHRSGDHRDRRQLREGDHPGLRP